MTFRPRRNRARQPAAPMQPLVDPAGWTGEELAAAADWIYRLSAAEIGELESAVASVRRQGMEIRRIGRDDFPLPTLGPALLRLRDELLEGRGFVLVRGVPVARMDREQAALAFWGIGAWLGRAVSQNGQGHLLGHVKDLGGDYADANTRGYLTAAEMGFHADRCDYVGLLCLQPSRSGGASRIASSVTLYNELLRRAPEHVAELVRPFAWTRLGEIPPGMSPWYELPVFSFHDGYFSARGVSSQIFKAQGLPGVRPFTEAQRAALDAFRETVREIAFDMAFEPGDVQFLHNHVILHSRTAYEDWPEPERKRHLLRLWLCDDAGRPLAPEVREHFEGIALEGAQPSTPLDVSEAA
jgi:hypothetical protein